MRDGSVTEPVTEPVTLRASQQGNSRENVTVVTEVTVNQGHSLCWS